MNTQPTRNEPAVVSVNDERLHRLIRAWTAEIEAFEEAHTNSAGRFLDPNDQVEFKRMVEILNGAREALGLPV